MRDAFHKKGSDIETHTKLISSTMFEQKIFFSVRNLCKRFIHLIYFIVQAPQASISQFFNVMFEVIWQTFRSPFLFVVQNECWMVSVISR